MLNLALLVIGGLFLGIGWFGGKPYNGWKGRAVSGLFVGIIGALIIQLAVTVSGNIQEHGMSVVQLVLYIGSVILGSLFARRAKTSSNASSSRIDVPSPEDRKEENTVAGMVVESLQLEKDIRNFKQEFALQDSFWLKEAEENRRNAVRCLRKGDANEARNYLNRALRYYGDEVTKTRTMVENRRQFEAAVEKLSADEQSRLLGDKQ